VTREDSLFCKPGHSSRQAHETTNGDLEAVAACSALVVGVCVVEVWYGGYTGSTSFVVFGGGVKDLRVICNIVFM
jgi:hypothetical protein